MIAKGSTTETRVLTIIEQRGAEGYRIPLAARRWRAAVRRLARPGLVRMVDGVWHASISGSSWHPDPAEPATLAWSGW